jgi:SAM-dependent methyltransferase
MNYTANEPQAERPQKRSAELQFRRQEIKRYEQWFGGELSPLYKTPSPQDHQKVEAPNEKDASVLTWHKLHQEAKYLENLDLPSDAFKGMKLLEVGSGPMPSATCFKDCRLYCLEPLLPEYLQAGFPLHYYEGVTFIHGVAENIPTFDASFDAVISVNAIDHVDSIEETASEIRRVLKPAGLFRIHVHYHSPKICEPIELNDEIFRKLFGWCGHLRKISSSATSFSADLRGDERFVLWSNF